MDSIAAFKRDGCEFKSSLAGYLEKGSVHWKAVYVHRAAYTVCTIFLIIINIDLSEITKTHFIHH